jgi:signal peptidase I
MAAMTRDAFRRFLKYMLIDVFLAALLAYFLINYVVSAYRVDGDSMQPLLRDADRILIAKLAVRRGDVERFDVVVFYRPDEPEKSLIKRVIGLPGEIVELRDGEVYVNDQPLKQPFYGDDDGGRSRALQDLKPLLIPRGHYFVLGDNRPVSLDSRHFGPVPEKYIFGKAVYRYWPFADLGRFE